MHSSLYSTITLFAEILISACIYFTLYQGYKHNKFPAKLAGFALLYEILFNITYMISRVPAHAKELTITSSFAIGLAIVHGILSLIMFLALIIFFFLAWRKYQKGINYFASHKTFTILFLIFWTFSVASGILLYIFEYIV